MSTASKNTGAKAGNLANTFVGKVAEPRNSSFGTRLEIPESIAKQSNTFNSKPAQENLEIASNRANNDLQFAAQVANSQVRESVKVGNEK
ncbi:MAG: hypothetical protein HC908_14325 [Calothrix sp. SM1_7_51]|nr:hypothetical protein [Calothrix sp. SM1_7_51]